MALRENPVRALSLGVDTRRYTLMAFALRLRGLGGISGVLYAAARSIHRPDAVLARCCSLNLLSMVIVGGSGYFLGPFLGSDRRRVLSARVAAGGRQAL